MLLKKLCNAAGPSSFEGEVRKIIKEEIKDFVDEIKVDRMGNIIAHKKGSGKKIMLDAHMDEVGFIITAINEDGTMKFASLGGINSKIIPSKVVYIGENKIPGVIGIKPIHLQNGEERKNSASYENCCIDIGSKSKEETKKHVSLGDYAVFDTEYGEFGEGFIKAKALDDRVGCAVLIELLKENYECDLYAVFNVQEEVGERGAYVSAFSVRPDIGIAIEGTICADMPNIPEQLRATELTKGPAISIMDKTSIYNEEIIEDLIKVAKENNVPYQRRKAVAGGNDAGAIVSSTNGAKIAAVSVPCRYIHSSVSVANLEDIENTVELLKKYLLGLKGVR
ncbi:M42 family metallopeptidase [Clostridium felsineum]|uniref:M42 family metallopeptidase n=1 Tax=Clostridium felsineum TaxID=36839 RepID=UPI00214DE80E|nr:M42 family metallopeptidase [Clostridium felsineum]MCR3759703.1 M42 family metallopeptidase [Clostridium felsineum]